jgi:tRNA A37 threonylcarbamoyladenosine dehydratase
MVRGVTGSEQRFGGIARLHGAAGLARLRRSHVCVVGIGGVGAWAVEALARSGVGALTLVDLDEICVSNINRQVHALDGTVGRAKVEVMAERIRAIDPAARVETVTDFFTAESAGRIFAPSFDFVIDAIDNTANKCRLITLCRDRKIPLITCGGAGGRRDPTAIRIGDLADASHDRLLAQVRKQLRAEHDFPRPPAKMGVPCVFSTERPVFPQTDGTVCTFRDAAAANPEAAESPRLNCNSGLGSAAFVTGAFGFAAAAHAVTHIAAA